MVVKKTKFRLTPAYLNYNWFYYKDKCSGYDYAGKFNSFVKNLRLGKRNIDGRNNSGRITVFQRGAGVKRNYRLVDFFRYIWNMKAQVLTMEYDPNRTTLLNLILYTHGVLSYVPAVDKVSISTMLGAGAASRSAAEDRFGYCSKLKGIKPGTFVNSVESRLLRGAQYVRAAAGYAKLVSLTLSYAIIKLRSQFLLKINNNCIATVGVLSHSRPYKTSSMLKAGFNRRLGFRSSVRGVAKNPVDHPHGGGQGKTSGGRTSVTPWAEITKGRKTRRKITYGSIILKR